MRSDFLLKQKHPETVPLLSHLPPFYGFLKKAICQDSGGLRGYTDLELRIDVEGGEQYIVQPRSDLETIKFKEYDANVVIKTMIFVATRCAKLAGSFKFILGFFLAETVSFSHKYFYVCFPKHEKVMEDIFLNSPLVTHCASTWAVLYRVRLQSTLYSFRL